MTDVDEFTIHVDPVSFTFDGPDAIGNPGPPGDKGDQGPKGDPGPQGDPADPAVTDALRTDLTAETARAVDAEATGLAYVRSRGQNLVTNGTGLLGDNANFSTFTFDPADTYTGAGSFRVNVAQQTVMSDELIPVDPAKTYRLTGWAKCGDLNGANFNPANRQYFGVSVYDVDGNPLTNVSVTKRAGAADTTLAVALNPGDLTVALTDGTGWYNGATGENRTLVWWPYTNNAGYSYPAYTYTRNGLIAGWAQNGIVGNVITLAAPWAGPALPVGTPVRNAPGTTTSNRHVAALNVTVPNTWTRYSGRIGTVETTGVINHAKFPPGTAYVRLLFLVNYHDAADNNVRWNNLTFTDAETELAIETLAPPPLPDIQVFTASGTWTKPSGAYTVADILCIAGGTGGGSGRRGAAGTIRCGGGGGASGATSFRTVPMNLLGTTETVSVGSGGAGGPAQTVDDNNGNAGATVGSPLATSVGAGTNLWVRAGNATAGGAGGTATTGTGGAAQLAGTLPGSAGHAASTTGGVATSVPVANPSAGPGSAGGGVTAANVPSNGATGAVSSSSGRPGGAAGTAPGGNGGDAVNSTGNDTRSGGGGGGGAGSITGPGGRGGNGGFPGGGGGGGGASANGFDSGAGGNGAGGLVMIISR